MLADLQSLPAHDLSWLVPSLKKIHFNTRNIAALGDLSIPDRVAEADRQLAPQGPLGTALRAFVLNTPVPAADLDAAVGDHTSQRLVAAGLARIADGDITLLVSLGECYGALTLADPYPTASRPGLQDGQVLNVGNASILAAEFTVRAKVSRAADIGCGQGLQSLLLSAHADHVVATDVNPRALAFTHASAALNGCASRIQGRLGSLLDPVKGEKFGVVVSNPPFVMRATASGASAISSAFVGDAVVEALARGVPGLLADHGWFTMICNWHHASEEGSDWSERPRSWFAASGVDVWIVRSQTVTAGHYGRIMLQMDGVEAGSAFDARLADWNAWCAAQNARFVSFGLMIARERKGANWMRVESIPMTHRRGAGSDLVRNIFAGQTLLTGLANPSALLESRLRRASTLQAVAVPADAAYQQKIPAGSVQLQHVQGWAMPQVVTPDVSRFVQAFDGSRSAGEQAHAAIRALGGMPPGPEQLARVLIGMVRSGFLVPVSATGEVLL